MTLPVTITGISTAVATVGPFKCSVGVAATVYTIATPMSAAVSWGDATARTRICQTFTTASDTATITSISLGLSKTGTPVDNLKVDLFAVDGSSMPTGSSLGTSAVIAGSTLTSAGVRYAFAFASAIAVSPSTQYAAVISRSGAVDAVNNYSMRYSSTTSNIDAAQVSGQDNGTSWASTTRDFDLIVNGTTTAPPVDAYYFFGRDGTTATTLQAYKAGVTVLAGATGASTSGVGGTINTTARSQSFTVPAITGGAINSINVSLSKFGTPTDNIKIDIYATNGASQPTGSSLGTSAVISGSTLTTSAATYTFTFTTPVAVTASTQYAAVLSRSGGIDASNSYTWNNTGTDVTAGEGNCQYNGSVWTTAGTADLPVVVSISTGDPSVAWSSIATRTGFTTAILNIAGYQVGNVIHLLVQDGTGPATLVATKYLSFDAATDTFLATTETVSAAAIMTGSAASGWGCSLVVRSNGEVVAFYNGVQTKVSTNWSRVYYRRRTAVNTYGTETMVDAGLGVNNTVPIAVLGASDRVHFLFYNATNTLQRHLTSANVLGTVASTGATTAVQDACAFDNAGTIQHVGYTAAQDIRWSSADNPTVTAASITFGTPVRATDDGTTAWALYQNSADSDLYVKSSTDFGATFGTAVSAFVATVASADANLSKNQTIYTRGNSVVIPYVVNDNGTLKYNEYVVRSLGVSGTLATVEDRDTAAFTGTLSALDVTGTLNTTEAADTAAFTGTVVNFAVLATTEAADTASFTGNVTWLATLNTTEAADTAALTGSVAWSAALATTEASDTASFTGSIYLDMVLATTEAPDFFNFIAPITLTGTLAATEAPDSFNFTGLVSWSAVLATTEAKDTASFNGLVGLLGTLVTTEDRDTASLNGQVAWTAVLAATEATDAANINGILGLLGTLAATEASDAASFTGSTAWLATWATVEPRDTAAFTGITSADGTLATTEAGDSASFTGQVTWLVTLNATEAADSAVITGLAGAIGPLVTTEAADIANLTGAVSWSMTLAATEAADTAVITAVVAWGMVLAATEATDTAAFIGNSAAFGSLNAVEAPDTAAFAGTVINYGTLSVTELGDNASFEGTVINFGIKEASEQPDVADFSVRVEWILTLATTEASDTANITGGIVGTGTLNATEAADIAAFSSDISTNGALLATEASDIAAFVGDIHNAMVLNTTEAADSAAFIGNLAASGTLAVTELGDNATFMGSVVNYAILAATETRDTASFTGTVVNLGVLAASEATDQALFTGSIGLLGTLAVTETRDTAAFIGNVGVVGILQASEAPDVASFTGIIGLLGILAATETRDTAAFTGLVRDTCIGTLNAFEGSDSCLFIGELLDIQQLLAVEQADNLLFLGNVDPRIKRKPLPPSDWDYNWLDRRPFKRWA